ncbi:hypothetical protein [Jannaschia seohaensis]|uniref:Tat pathway signal sequence domain protein n=1 Tax=Jannaschia seohaensis TaxID=475081 RepID=A0A2Y9AY33_9RHOB|nr:hypothetical protein [Jannaschia seohaensis]PWJ16568.1 hypothetical protein BCF38_10882 [Jannaschia seohaensis]SSA48805.1 hypothetical protein SAMN05421539_10882 [Jannaschia seohaensis]
MRGLMLAALAAAGLAGPAAAQGITVELNKLEAGEEGQCRAFFLFRNGDDRSFEAFEMSLALIDTDGVIDQLLTIDAAPLPVDRTTLKLFEFPGLACDALGEVLLHDMTACRPQNGEEIDCFPLLTLESRADVALVK